MVNLRQSVLPDIYAGVLKNEAFFPKLQAIAGAHKAGVDAFTVSMSLMKPDAILFHPSERDFAVLGYGFEKRLDTDYEYCDVTLYSFAQAIASNQVRYEIFTVLSKHPPMTSAELSMRLNLSRNELAYNIRAMVKSRLLNAEPVNKRTYRYGINREYLQTVSRQLSMVNR
jgi:hypothetical protein